MLVRNENEIQIKTDAIKKGIGIKCIIIGIVIAIIFVLLAIPMKMDFSIIQTYLFILTIYFLPSYLFIIAGIILIRKEKAPSKIVARVNKNLLEIYNKKRNKRINLYKITKVNKLSSPLGAFIVIFYNDDNGIECKYSFLIGPTNQNLLIMAIKEYNNNIIVNEIT